jgi:hypothetical protein
MKEEEERKKEKKKARPLKGRRWWTARRNPMQVPQAVEWTARRNPVQIPQAVEWTARRNPVQIPASGGQRPVVIFTQDLSQTFFFSSKNKTKEQIKKQHGCPQCVCHSIVLKFTFHLCIHC